MTATAYVPCSICGKKRKGNKFLSLHKKDYVLCITHLKMFEKSLEWEIEIYEDIREYEKES